MKPKKKKKDKKRVDMDVRPYPSPIFRNYDYGGPENGGEVSPGTGLYHGKMDKYKSVKDFIEKSRKRFRKRRKKSWLQFFYKIANNNYEREWSQRIEEIAKNNPKPFNQWFDGKDRVYIPFDPGITEQSREDINAFRDDVLRALKDRYPDKCQEIDFTGGYCMQGQRKTRIGKLLNSAMEKELKEAKTKFDELASTEDHELNPEFIAAEKKLADLNQYWTDIMTAYTTSPIRSGAKTRKDARYYIVISQNPHDLAKMSTGRNWVSCMQLGKGQHYKDVFCEVEKGGIIAYLIKSNDLNIENPISRIHIRRFENMNGESFAKAEETVYGDDIPGFEETVSEWINQKQKTIKPGVYTRVGGQYSDTFESSLTVAPSAPGTEEEMLMWLTAPDKVEGAIITYWVVTDDFQNYEDCEDDPWRYYVEDIPLEKQFSDESEAHKYALIMNQSESNWNFMEALEREVIQEVSYSLTGGHYENRDDLVEYLEENGTYGEGEPLDSAEAEKIVDEEISSSQYGRYLDPAYERFKVSESKDDQTDQMKRAVVADVLKADKNTYSKDIIDSVKRELFDKENGGNKWEYSSLKEKFIEKFSDEYPDLYNYFKTELNYDNLKKLEKAYKSLKSGSEKEAIGNIFTEEIEFAFDAYQRYVHGENVLAYIKDDLLTKINLMKNFDRVPANITNQAINFGKNILKEEGINIHDKELIINNIVHNFAMTKTDTPDLQRFYQDMLGYINVFPEKRRWPPAPAGTKKQPKQFELGLSGLGWAIARLGENGRQFIPFFKKKLEEVKNWRPQEYDDPFYIRSLEDSILSLKDNLKSSWPTTSEEDKEKAIQSVTDSWNKDKEKKEKELIKWKKRQIESILYIIDCLETGKGYSRKFVFNAR